MLSNNQVAAFHANKNGSAQSSIADNATIQITFGNEVFDNGGCFATNAWTPPAGLVRIGASFYATGTTTAGFGTSIYIYKDGAAIARFSYPAGTNATYQGIQVIIEDIASGANAYTAYANMDLSGSGNTWSISGDNATTYFWGFWISR